MHTFCEFCQIINHIVWQTVRAGTDIDANNTRLIDSLFVAFLDNLKRSVGIGKILKINQIFLNFWPLAVHKVNLMVKLLTNRRLRSYNGVPRPRYRTKGTATVGHCAITVGTIKARIYRKFENLFAKNFTIVIIDCSITFFHKDYYNTLTLKRE